MIFRMVKLEDLYESKTSPFFKGGLRGILISDMNSNVIVDFDYHNQEIPLAPFRKGGT